VKDLLAQIAANPDDPAPYLVYADALQQKGDPRGDVIIAQHGLETAAPREAAELRRREVEAILANIDRWFPFDAKLRTSLYVRWRHGFVHAVRAQDGDALAALLAAPDVASTLVDVRMAANRLPVLTRLWPTALRRLESSMAHASTSASRRGGSTRSSSRTTWWSRRRRRRGYAASRSARHTTTSPC
jgi:uncharacterized protein (TIGR02996 family)